MLKEGMWCHVAIPSRDIQRSKDFYGGVFGWTFADTPGKNYTRYFPSQEAEVGGDFWTPPEGIRYEVVNYVLVDEIEPVLAKVRECGGSVVKEKEEVAGAGWYAHVQDPDRNLFGLWKSASRAEPSADAPASGHEAGKDRPEAPRNEVKAKPAKRPAAVAKKAPKPVPSKKPAVVAKKPAVVAKKASKPAPLKKPAVVAKKASKPAPSKKSALVARKPPKPARPTKKAAKPAARSGKKAVPAGKKAAKPARVAPKPAKRAVRPAKKAARPKASPKAARSAKRGAGGRRR